MWDLKPEGKMTEERVGSQRMKICQSLRIALTGWPDAWRQDVTPDAPRRQQIRKELSKVCACALRQSIGRGENFVVVSERPRGGYREDLGGVTRRTGEG